MLRGSVGLALVATAVLGAAHERTARADTTQLGLFFGPRVYSEDTRLGYIDDAPFHPVLTNAFEFGFRVGRPFLPWLIPELELGMAPTSTTTDHAPAASVFWLEPRLHLRLDLLPGRRFDPFFVIGGGSPIALSGARQTYDTGIVGEGYVGAGVRVSTGKGFAIRLDARMGFVPGETRRVDVEADFAFGLEFDLSKHERGPAERVVKVTPLDHDGDGVPDDKDKCPDRPEDMDGFEDHDGCPDIDNDGDGVLDIADKCPNVPETYNGFEDEDGCPDVVPPDVDSLRGTIEGLIYADGETVVRDSALPQLEKISKIMKAHPSIRVVLIGHTDNQEAKQFAQKPDDPNTPAQDLAFFERGPVARARRGGGAGARHAGHRPLAHRGRGPRGRGARLGQREAARSARQPTGRDQAVRTGSPRHHADDEVMRAATLAIAIALAGCSHATAPRPMLPICLRAEAADHASGIQDFAFDADGNLLTQIEYDNAGKELARTTVTWSATAVTIARTGGAFPFEQRATLGEHGELLALDGRDEHVRLAWSGAVAAG